KQMLCDKRSPELLSQ
ncbi:hypothetical protein VC87395_003267B, partial [Vibrio paracholerae 87395]